MSDAGDVIQTQVLPVVGYPKYLVSSAGDVYSLPNRFHKEILKLKPFLRNNYLSVDLYHDRRMNHHNIHRLVAMTFLPNPDNKPVVNHIDLNTVNNHLKNLEWCTQKENIHHSLEIAFSKPNARGNSAKLQTQDVRDIKLFLSKQVFTNQFLAKIYKVSTSTIEQIRYGKSWIRVK